MKKNLLIILMMGIWSSFLQSTFAQISFQNSTASALNLPTLNSIVHRTVDLNNDNLDDLISNNATGEVQFHINNGNGTFSIASVGINANITNGIITNADFTNDGLQDLVFIYSDSIIFYANNPSGFFTNVTSTLGITNPPSRKFFLEASAGWWDDWDNDGDLDLLFSSKDLTSSYIEVFVNNINSFTRQTILTFTLPLTPLFFACDYDNDQDQDLFILQFNNTNPPFAQYNYFAIKLYQKTNTTYSDVTAGSGLGLGSNHGYATPWDYNNDGFVDIIMGSTDNVFNSSHVNRVYKNNGNSTFSDVSTTLNLKVGNDYYRDVNTHDFDNDSDLDVFYTSNNYFFKNTNGTFSSNIISSTGLPNSSVGAYPTIIDYNNDGKLDMIFAPIQPYTNISPTVNYVNIKLSGCTAAKDPRGTRVVLYAGGQKQTRYLQGGNVAQESNILHFGINNNTTVDSVKVYWSNGSVSKITQININSLNILSQSFVGLNAGNDLTICAGEQVTLTATGANTYSWNNGVTNGNTFSPSTSNTYTVTGTNSLGCTATDQVIIIVNPTPTVNAGPDQAICEGAAVTLSGTGASSYSWSNAITNGVAFVPASTNTYTVTGTNADGCSNTDEVNVVVNENGFITIDETAMDSYTLNGQTYTQSGTYIQVIPTLAGCDSTITLNLTLSFTGLSQLEKGINMYPNPTNDVLHLEGIEILGLSYTVFDATGRLVLQGTFENHDIHVSSLQSGTYTLQLQNTTKPLRFVKE